MVTLIKGKSFKPETMSAVRQALGPDQVGLLILMPMLPNAET